MGDDIPSDESAKALQYWDRVASTYASTRIDGHYARTLAARGAVVNGIDGSREMIALASRDTPSAGIGYHVADLTTRFPFADRSFDVVVANMVLMDVPRIDGILAECARVLIAHGTLVFSMTHPCFFCSDWVHDERGAKLHKAVADYLTPKVEPLDFWGPTLHFHRPLSHYFDALAQAGFTVDAFKEPLPSEADLAQHPQWQHHRRIPSFAVIRGVRRQRGCSSNAPAGTS